MKKNLYETTVLIIGVFVMLSFFLGIISLQFKEELYSQMPVLIWHCAVVLLSIAYYLVLFHFFFIHRFRITLGLFAVSFLLNAYLLSGEFMLYMGNMPGPSFIRIYAVSLFIDTTFYLSLIYSRSSEHLWLKRLGYIGSIFLLTMLISLISELYLGVSPVLFESIHRYIGVLSNLLPVFYILNLNKLVSQSDPERILSGQKRLKYILGSAFLLSLFPALLIMGKERVDWKYERYNLEHEYESAEAVKLFGQSQIACKSVQHNFGDFRLENNVWNAGSLEINSYAQCIYLHEENGETLFGWSWNYPSHSYGISAYPEVIYGHKPWSSRSTTKELPKRVSGITHLKVNYDTEMNVKSGLYHLAFDLWVVSKEIPKPGNIEYEVMIWEDASISAPYGTDYMDVVTTTNGDYSFYKGNADWAPQGSQWKYLVFKRRSNRTKGTVDIDELLSYLIKKEIIPSDYFLSSVEFGVEIGNSRGYCVVKEYEIQIE